jgi:uncharacterized protein
MGDSGEKKTGFWGAIPRFFLVRLVLFTVLLTLAYGGLQAASHLIGIHLPAIRAGVLLYGSLVIAIVMPGFYALVVRWIEGRWPREIALKPGLPLALGGVLIGGLLFASTFAILFALNVAHWETYIGFGAVASPLALSIGAGVGEEILVRGGIFRVLEDSFGSLIALVLSAALFGFLHAANKGATPFSSVAIALEAGVLLAAAYIASRNLWLPIGIHIGWNFTEGGVFGAAISGGSFSGIIKTSFSGPDRLTGGAFGPEASVVAVGVCLAAALVFLAIGVRAGRWKPLAFRLLLPRG